MLATGLGHRIFGGLDRERVNRDYGGVLGVFSFNVHGF